MRARGVAAGLVAVALAIAACGSFSGDSESTPTPTPDAGPDVATPLGDATASDVDVDAAGLSFCERQARADFCLSFDDTNDKLTAGRADVVVLSTGSQPVPLDGGDAFSPPGAMATEVTSAVTPVGNPGLQSGIMLKTSSRVATQLHCEMQVWADFIGVRPDAGEPKEGVDVLLGAIGTQATRRLFDFSLIPKVGATTLNSRTGFSENHVPGLAIAERTWVPVSLDLALTGAEATIKAAVDHTSTATVSVSTDLAHLEDISLWFGQSYVTGHWQVRLDDIVCRWEP